MVEDVVLKVIMNQNEKTVYDFLKYRTIATGSRYWSQIAPDVIVPTPQSDYDFIVGVNDPVIEEARKLAEKYAVKVKDFTGYTLDPSTESVLCFGVHTQLIVKRKEWYAEYLKVQSLCSPEFYHNYLWKQNGNSKDQIRERLVVLMDFFKRDLKIEKKAIPPFEILDVYNA